MAAHEKGSKPKAVGPRPATGPPGVERPGESPNGISRQRSLARLPGPKRGEKLAPALLTRAREPLQLLGIDDPRAAAGFDGPLVEVGIDGLGGLVQIRQRVLVVPLGGDHDLVHSLRRAPD